MFFKTILLVFGWFVANCVAKNEEYMGHKVYNIKLHSQQQQNSLMNVKSDLIDYWRRPCWKYDVTGAVMVPPSHWDWFEASLKEIGIEKDVLIEDVFGYLKTRDVSVNYQNSARVFDFEGYHRYDVILTHLYNLADTYADTTTNLEVVQHGVTDENRPLVYVKLTSGNEDGRPVAIVEAAINPRDWVTVPSAMNVINQLLEEENRSLLEEYVWIIVPVVNPDGYEYTHTNLRLWQKTRSHRSDLGFICPGVNIDRNFDIDWQTSGASSSACSHLYAGVAPHSEPETQFIHHITTSFNPIIYISLQNIGKIITFPWNYEKAATGLYRRHLLLGLSIKPDDYILDSGAIAFGDRMSGTSVDNARVKGGLYTYTVGVEGEGDDGVIVPVEEIGRVADDVWTIVAAAARGVRSE